MESTLTISFNTQRTYLCGMQSGEKGLELSYVHTMNEYLDISHDDCMEGEGIALLHEALSSLAVQPKSIVAVLPPELMLMQLMPAIPLGSAQDASDMLNLEIMQNSPDHSIEDYHAQLYTLTPKLDGSELMLAVLIERAATERVQRMIGALGIPIRDYCSRQLAAHAALRYNYPELNDKSVIVFGIKGKTIEVSALNKGWLSYYNVVTVANAGAISDACDAEVEKVLAGHVPFLDAGIMYGEGLTREILAAVQMRLSGLLQSVERLNAFRMTTAPTLDERTRMYCSRMAQVFAPNVGAALPPIHEILFSVETQAA